MGWHFSRSTRTIITRPNQVSGRRAEAPNLVAGTVLGGALAACYHNQSLNVINFTFIPCCLSVVCVQLCFCVLAQPLQRGALAHEPRSTNKRWRRFINLATRTLRLLPTTTSPTISHLLAAQFRQVEQALSWASHSTNSGRRPKLLHETGR